MKVLPPGVSICSNVKQCNLGLATSKGHAYGVEFYEKIQAGSSLKGKKLVMILGAPSF